MNFFMKNLCSSGQLSYLPNQKSPPHLILSEVTKKINSLQKKSKPQQKPLKLNVMHTLTESVSFPALVRTEQCSGFHVIQLFLDGYNQLLQFHSFTEHSLVSKSTSTTAAATTNPITSGLYGVDHLLLLWPSLPIVVMHLAWHPRPRHCHCQRPLSHRLHLLSCPVAHQDPVVHHGHVCGCGCHPVH